MKKFIVKESVKKLNYMKFHVIEKTFTKDVLREVFKECNIPINEWFWIDFSHSGLIQQVGEGLWCFTDDTPIFYQKLQQIYDDYKKRSWKYKENYNANKKKSDIQEAINLLKENGYIVLKSKERGISFYMM